MLDAWARRIIDPPLNAAGKKVASSGASANLVTISGLVFALLAALFIYLDQMVLAIAAIVINRFADGLDGAVARATEKTDLGGYLDIIFDFTFYGAVPFAFAMLDPQANALAATALLFSFYLNGSTFLAFATIAEKHQISTSRQGIKSFYYLGGLAEGTETILLFVLFCLLPSYFSYLAWAFAIICYLSAISRVFLVVSILKNAPSTKA